MPKPLNLSRVVPALAISGALALAASGCGTSAADVQRGRSLFVQNCGTCHTMAQAGTSGQAGPNLDDAFAAARESGQTDSTIEGVVKAQVENPRPKSGNPGLWMPPNVVTGQDLDDVAAYVGQWAGVTGAAPPEVAGGAGAQVFANSGCGGCHTLAAAEAGGTVGPNLDQALTPSADAAAIEEMIVDPNADVAKGFQANVMPLNFGEMLSPKELEDLVQYLIENTPAGGGKGGSGKGA